MNEQLGRKMNQDVNRNRKMFWKDLSKVNGSNVEICSRIKDGNWRLALGEDKLRKIWMVYFEDL